MHKRLVVNIFSSLLLGAALISTPVYAAGQDRPADEIEWRGARYRVASVRRWDACGYIQAVAVRSGTERSEE